MELHRFSGEGDAQQKWIDDNLPTCPFCRSPAPWRVGTEADQQALVRWLFQCPNCMVVLSTVPDASVSVKAGPYRITKTPLDVLIRVESAERKQDEDFVSEEFPLSELQEWAEEEES